jgi:hypothetical protein
LVIKICIVKPENEEKGYVKDVPSTDGMKYSLETSELMKMKLEANLSDKHIS